MEQLRCFICDTVLLKPEVCAHLKTHAEELHGDCAKLSQALKDYLEAFQIAEILFAE